MTGDAPTTGLSIYVGLTPGFSNDMSQYACTLDVSSEYISITIRCITPVTGRFVTMYQSGVEMAGDPHHEYGLNICDIRIYGSGKLAWYMYLNMVILVLKSIHNNSNDSYFPRNIIKSNKLY